MNFVLNFIIYSAAVFISARLLPGIYLRNIGAALGVALVLVVSRYTIKPVVSFLSFPVNVLTLGLFGLLVNGIIVLLASAIIKDFKVEGILPAILYSIVLAIVSSVLNFIF